MNRSDLEQYLIGESRAMQQLRAMIERVAPTHFAILIQGPTGSGKEMVAQALHRLSGREGRFVAVNVAAVPDAMFEDEFFGHVRGAFTGAVRDRVGLIAEANRGTLFLDEVGSFTATAQPKLLRVLETKAFRPVGAGIDHRSDFRTLAATNEDLDVLTRSAGFRRDLRRRLAECVLQVPSLASRREDIPLLACHFARRTPAADGVSITPDGLRALQSYDWPDNVRELRQVIELAIALANGPWVDARVVRSALGARTATHSPEHLGDIVLIERRLRTLLAECAWDTEEVARRLGINRSTVYRRMRRFGITVPGGRLRSHIGQPAPADDSTSIVRVGQ